MPNPFIFGEPLDLRSHPDLFARGPVIDLLSEYVDSRSYCLVLGPKHSGRTTVLLALGEKRGLDQGCVTIYIHPKDLNLTSEPRFFASLAERIEREVRSAGPKLWPESIDHASYRIDATADQFNSFIDDTLAALRVCLVLLLDAVERIPPNILTRFAHIAHGIYSERVSRVSYRNLCVIFAGSLSLRHLTYQERPELSPFNVCEDIVLFDLDAVDAGRFLKTICRKHRLPFNHDGIAAAVEYAGGDVDMLQRVASAAFEGRPKGRGVDRQAVESAVRGLIGESGQPPAVPLRLAAALAEEDPSTLDLVLSVLEKGSVPYEPDPLQDRLYNAFKVTAPEMAGVLSLERTRGIPVAWRFRNRITELFFRRFFTPQRIVKTYSALGQFDKAERHCGPLLKKVREQFEKDVLDFDDNDLKDVLIAFTNRIYQEGAHEIAYKFLDRLLEDGFGYHDVTYYDYVPTQRTLREVKFLSHLFSNRGAEINVDRPEDRGLIEVRALESKLFAVESEQGIRRIAIPLCNLTGEATGVLVIRSTPETDREATINLRIQIVQRALQAINVALNKVELDHKSKIADSLTLMRERGGSVDVFVAHRFNQELLTNLREHLGRVNDLLKFKYGDDGNRVGVLLEAIKRDIQSARLCLFEISHPNNNVYFEVGLGLGFNKAGLMFWREVQGARAIVPPLLAGISRIGYADYNSLLENLVGRVESVLKQYLLHETAPGHLHFAGVSVPEVRKLRAYAVVLESDYYGDQNDYRRVVDEELSKRGLTAVYPVGGDPLLGEVLERKADGGAPVPRVCDWYNLISHADMVIARIEKTDNDPIAGQVFIGLGIAFGLTRSRISLTHLRRDFRDMALEIPADLRGITCLEYETFAQLRERLARSLSNGSEPSPPS